MRPALWVQTRLWKWYVSRCPQLRCNARIASQLLVACCLEKNIPGASSFTVGSRARVPNGFVRHGCGWGCSRGSLGASLGASLVVVSLDGIFGFSRMCDALDLLWLGFQDCPSARALLLRPEVDPPTFLVVFGREKC